MSGTVQHWYALHVKPRAEKKVAERIAAERGAEAYLPLQRTLRQRSDRRKWVEEPLLRGYVFVRGDAHARTRALLMPGALRFVVFDGRPAPIPDNQIDILRRFADSGAELEVEDGLLPGEKVEIIDGPFGGIRGELVSVRGRNCFGVLLGSLGKTLLVTVSAEILRRIPA